MVDGLGVDDGVLDGLVGERLDGLDVVELDTRFCSSYHRSHKI